MSSKPPVSQFFNSRIIYRSPPESVIYDLTSPSKTIIILPKNSKWTSGLHWHETHTEYLRVLQGSIKVTLGNQKLIASAPSSGEKPVVLVVERGVRHEWSRAISDEEGVDVVVEESTAPDDGLKTVFFWAVNDVVLTGIESIKSASTGYEQIFEGWKLWWRLMCVFWELDNWPVVYGRLRWVQWFSTLVVLAAVGTVSQIFRMEVVRQEGMPKDVWDVWVGGRRKEGKKRN